MRRLALALAAMVLAVGCGVGTDSDIGERLEALAKRNANLEAENIKLRDQADRLQVELERKDASLKAEQEETQRLLAKLDEAVRPVEMERVVAVPKTEPAVEAKPATEPPPAPATTTAAPPSAAPQPEKRPEPVVVAKPPVPEKPAQPKEEKGAVVVAPVRTPEPRLVPAPLDVGREALVQPSPSPIPKPAPEFTQAPQPSAQRLDIAFAGVEEIVDGDVFKVRGQIQNNTPDPIREVAIMATFYDVAGKTVCSQSTMLRGGAAIAAGRAEPFELTVTDASRIRRYKLRAHAVADK